MSKKPKEHKTQQFVFRASDAYRHWLRCLAADSGMQVSEFIEECIAEHARRMKKSPSPRRWPPETEA